MKRLIYILSLLVTTNVYSNNFIKDAEPAILEVHYTRTEIRDTTNRDKSFTKDPVFLRIGKNKSVFCGTKRLWRDSIIVVNPDIYWDMEMAKMDKAMKTGVRDDNNMATGHYWSYIYKNIPEGNVSERCYFNLEHWKYSEEWEKPEWEITDRTKTILGYECVEATSDYRGRQWTAWFAPDIPVQEGPWKLCGLPGLILEAYDKNKEYIFEADGIIQNPNSEVGIFTYDEQRGYTYTTVTRDKFFNNWWKYKHSNLAEKMRAAFGSGPAPSSDKKTKVVHYDKEETNYPHDL